LLASRRADRSGVVFPNGGLFVLAAGKSTDTQLDRKWNDAIGLPTLLF
jgi:hypothetical protein